MLNPPVACGDSPPELGGLWHGAKLALFAKAAPTRGGGIAEQ